MLINTAFFEAVLADFLEKGGMTYLCDASVMFRKEWYLGKKEIIVLFAKYYLRFNRIESFRVSYFSAVLFNPDTYYRETYKIERLSERQIRVNFLEFTIRLLKEPLLFGMYHLRALEVMEKDNNCLRFSNYI